MYHIDLQGCVCICDTHMYYHVLVYISYILLL
jgi:hypothetical protein